MREKRGRERGDGRKAERRTEERGRGGKRKVRRRAEKTRGNSDNG